MKLLNINIGIRIDNAKEISKLIVDQNADFVAMQEVVHHLDESVFEEYRSKRTIEEGVKHLYPYRFFGPLWTANEVRKNGKVTRNFGGRVEQGNEVLSKHPITLEANEFFYKTYGYKNDWTDWEKEDHARALLISEHAVGDKHLRILNIHGIWTADKKGDVRTIKECEFVLKKALESHLPTIVTGDFNLLPNTESIATLNSKLINLTEVYKITSTRPDFKDHLEAGSNVVDYIFVNDKVRVTDYKVIESNVSDHLPLVLEFEL